MVESASVLQHLVATARLLSQSIAQLFLQCEEIIGLGASRKPSLQEYDVHVPRELVDQWKASPYGPATLFRDRGSLGSFAELPDRLERLALRAWKADHRSGLERCPDVLALAATAIANPRTPSTLPIGKFAVIAALRTLYGITHSADGLEQLREAYLVLDARFRSQARRRVRKSSSAYEGFLLDLLMLSGTIRPTLSRENRQSYLHGFIRYPLGVVPELRRRTFAESEKWPQLSGSLPAFPKIITLAFSQPLAIPGLDTAIGGLIPAISDSITGLAGGQITLVVGAPGSGKTTLCLSIASRMADLGSKVRYMATEEPPHHLEAKLTTIGGTDYLATALWPEHDVEQSPFIRELLFVDGSSFADLSQVADELEREFNEALEAVVPGPANATGVFLVFPRVLVIDSLTTLLQRQESTAGNNLKHLETRRLVSDALRRLREMGVCVFLVGGEADAADSGIAYLVDNVLRLGLETQTPHRHQLRILDVEKTRLQNSPRGRHILHLSTHRGCSVSPSLHSVLRSLQRFEGSEQGPERRAIVWSAEELNGMLPPGTQRVPIEPVTIKRGAHSLVCGRGSASKARFAMYLAMEPRYPVDPYEVWLTYVRQHGQRRQKDDGSAFEPPRVLVLSFLYGENYYREIAADLIRRRIVKSAQLHPREASDVMPFYPGFLDPETLVEKLRERIEGARLDGRPYSAVVIDGIHNVLLQFPLLEQNGLLWAAVHAVLRGEGVDTISTFTVFRVEATHAEQEEQQLQMNLFAPGAYSDYVASGPDDNIGSGSIPLKSSQDLLGHLLVANCDYTFVVERPAGTAADGGLAKVRLASSIDGFKNQKRECWWNPETFAFTAHAH